MNKGYEAVVRDPSGRVCRYFASDSAEDAVSWFKEAYREITDSDPSDEEKRYFMGGFDVFVSSGTGSQFGLKRISS